MGCRCRGEAIGTVALGKKVELESGDFGMCHGFNIHLFLLRLLHNSITLTSAPQSPVSASAAPFVCILL